MRRAAAWAATAAVALTAAVVVAAPAASGSTRSDAWRSRAATAFNKARTLDSGSETAMTYALMAGASARLNGWTSSTTAGYLNRVYALQQPDGGYGIGESWDAFQDGSVNASDTTYTVSLAGHVGPVLLDGFKAGVVPRAKVQQVVDLLMAMPRISVGRGQCVAYSDQEADVRAGYCVHNVSAGVGAFLHAAADAGLGATGMHRLITDITIAELDAYQTAKVGWSYRDDGSTALQDPDHDSYSAESMYLLAYWVGREVSYRLMTTSYPGDPYSVIAHMRLTGLNGGVASWDRYSPTTPLWCVLGDRWLTEVDGFIANPPAPAANRLAQAAYYSARAGRCP